MDEIKEVFDEIDSLYDWWCSASRIVSDDDYLELQVDYLQKRGDLMWRLIGLMRAELDI